MNQFELKKNTDFGYLSLHPMPNKKELNHFYESLYYQNEIGQYSKQYSDLEIDYFQNDCRVLEFLYKSTFQNSKRESFLDIGCGEGFQSNYFHKHGWSVTCSDYSDFGIKAHFPHLLNKLIKGDMEDLFKTLNKQENQYYSIILLKNVIEHVIDPIETLLKIKKVMDKETLLCIDVPNDYSSFQSYLIENNYTKNTWYCPPQHLHYFQFESLRKLIEANGFEIVSQQAGFPIEQFLLNQHSNYSKNKLVGKEAHLTRCKVSNFLLNSDMKKYIQLREAYANLSFGRDIIMTVKIK